MRTPITAAMQILKIHNISVVQSKAGWTIEDITKAFRDAEKLVRYEKDASLTTLRTNQPQQEIQ